MASSEACASLLPEPRAFPGIGTAVGARPSGAASDAAPSALRGAPDTPARRSDWGGSRRPHESRRAQRARRSQGGRVRVDDIRGGAAARQASSGYDSSGASSYGSRASVAYGGDVSASDADGRFGARCDSGDGSGGRAKPRVLGALGVGVLGFLIVCSGPFGISDAVRAGGAGPTLLAILLLPIVWGCPQALMTAELSALIPHNGGSVLWVVHGLGPLPGFVAGWNAFLSNLCDLPLYAILLADYLGRALTRVEGGGSGSGASSDSGGGAGTLPAAAQWAIKGGALLVVAVVNTLGASSVTVISVVVTAFVVLPFMLEPFLDLAFLLPSHWASVAEPIDWPLFVSVMLWNFQGWTSLGSIAGEVKNAQRAYPLGIGLALLLMVATYSLPVAVGISVDPSLNDWYSGMLETIAYRLAPWLGVWVTAAASAATLGELNACLCAYSRTAWVMARRGWLPKPIGHESRRYGTPVGSIVLHVVACAGLMAVPFPALVVVDTMLNNISLLLQGVSFLALRYRRGWRERRRPFRVPCGAAGAWAVAVPKLCIVVAAIATAGLQSLAVGAALNVAIVAMYFGRRWWGRCGAEPLAQPARTAGGGAHAAVDDAVDDFSGALWSGQQDWKPRRRMSESSTEEHSGDEASALVV